MFRKRLERAIALRRPLEGKTSALRLVNAESDGFPGVVIDRYGSIAVCQFTSAGAEWARTAIVEQLRSLLPLETIYERSDPDVRTREGLSARCGLLHGAPLPELVEIEDGLPEGVLKGWRLGGEFVNDEPSATDTDIWAMAHQLLAITPLSLDWTDYGSL